MDTTKYLEAANFCDPFGVGSPGVAPGGMAPAPSGNFSNFIGELNPTTTQYVIPTTFSCPDDLLDFAHRKGKFYNKDPTFSNFLARKA